MRYVLAMLLIITAYVTCEAQSIKYKDAMYISWVHFNNGTEKIKCVMLEPQDSALLVIKSSSFSTNKIADSSTAYTVPVATIDKVKIRRRNGVGRGAKIGALSGALTGIFAGLVSGDDTCPPGEWCIILFSAEEKAIFGAVAGSVLGSTAGLLIGSFKKTIPIKGSQETYNSSKELLKPYSLNAQKTLSSSQ